MSSRKSEQRETATWKTLYDAALLEFNHDKLPEKIAQAQQALAERARELRGPDHRDGAELEAVRAAMRALEGLRKISGIDSRK